MYPPVPVPPPGRVSFEIDASAPGGFYGALGYACFGNLAVRCDMVERLASVVWALASKGPFALTGDAGAGLMSLAGCGADGMADILAGLGYLGKADRDGVLHFSPARPPRAKSKGGKPKQVAGPKKKQSKPAKDTPFAELRNLTVGR